MSPEWIESIATVAAVLCALFGQTFRRKIYKPKLVFKISNSEPHCLLLEQKEVTQSNVNYKVVEICGALTNLNNSCARNCRVLCTGLYLLDADNKSFVKAQALRQQQLPWSSIDRDNIKARIDIDKGTEYYVKIAEISQTSEMVANGQKSQKNAITEIRIPISNQSVPSSSYLTLDENPRNVIVSIRVLCDDYDSSDYFIRIDWKGTDANDFYKPGKLTVSLIDEKEAKTIIKS